MKRFSRRHGPREGPVVGAAARLSRRAMVLWAVASAAAVILLLSTTESSLALWNVSAPIASKTVVSGTLTATVALGDVASPTGTSIDFAPDTWSGMLPGESRQSDFTVANTGSTPFTLAASSDTDTAANRYVRFAMGPAPCATDSTDLTALTGMPVAVGGDQSV